jgi:hypothetical protein
MPGAPASAAPDPEASEPPSEPKPEEVPLEPVCAPDDPAPESADALSEPRASGGPEPSVAEFELAEVLPSGTLLVSEVLGSVD